MNEFDKIFRQKLQGYTETPPPEVFENISSKFPKQTPSGILSAHKFHISVAVAVVGIATALVFALLPSSNDTNQPDNILTENITPDCRKADMPVNANDNAAQSNSQTPKADVIDNSSEIKSSEIMPESDNKIDILDLKDTIICGDELLLENLDFSKVKTSNGLTMSKTAAGVKLHADTYGEHSICTDGGKTTKITFVKPETIEAVASGSNLCYGEKLLVTMSESKAKLIWNDESYSVSKLASGKYEISGLHAGSNSIVIRTDSERCPSMLAFDVKMAEKPLYKLSTRPDYCYAGNGELAINAKSTVNYCRINGGETSQSGKFDGLAAGRYVVEINYANSCVLYDTVFVGGDTGIKASFKGTRSAFNDTRYDFSNLTELNASGSKQNLECVWYVDGVAMATSYNFDYEFPGCGEYTVELVASLGKCESRHSETIVVKSNNFRIPNIFTPNGDGIGDEFTVIYDGVLSDYDLSIYTRSGQLVFHSQQLDKYWDGKISGNNDASEGVYFYVVKATDKNGEIISQKGTVQLTR